MVIQEERQELIEVGVVEWPTKSLHCLYGVNGPYKKGFYGHVQNGKSELGPKDEFRVNNFSEKDYGRILT